MNFNTMTLKGINILVYYLIISITNFSFLIEQFINKKADVRLKWLMRERASKVPSIELFGVQ